MKSYKLGYQCLEGESFNVREMDSEAEILNALWEVLLLIATSLGKQI